MNPRVDEIDYKYVRFAKPFFMHSDIIGDFVIPVGFVCDRESVPLIKGTSIRGGYAHDYLCRTDSVPVVDKKTAADVYLEIMTKRGASWWRRYLKYWAVRFAWGYFHKFPVLATYEEITA